MVHVLRVENLHCYCRIWNAMLVPLQGTIAILVCVWLGETVFIVSLA